jgi:hypothetical protein
MVCARISRIAERTVRTMSRTLEQAIIWYEKFANACRYHNLTESQEEFEQLTAWLRELKERREAPEIIRCGECIYYDPPHVENNGVRYEYTEMPADAFDVLGTGLVTTEYGINVGGRCCRDYNAGYDDDKRVYVPENNFCGRAERRTDD